MPAGAEVHTATKARILVADDEESMRHFLSGALGRHGFEVECVGDGRRAVARFAEGRFSVAVLDLKMPGMDGLEVLERIHRESPETVVILMTAYASVTSAVAAMKQGATDYVTKPFDIDELVVAIERGLERTGLLRENRQLRGFLDSRTSYGGLVGQSDAMRAVFQTIESLRDSSVTVLITGESGTGKELVARAIHQQSQRRCGPFVPVNCAAMPESLMESELFGYVPGAFTGAQGTRRGLLARADGGTLFLDGVSEMSLPSQARFIRFLQEREFTPLGAPSPVHVDVRVIAAANEDLQNEVEAGRFRTDLYWRLNVLPLLLPPLRARREDIPALVSQQLERLAGHHGPKRFSVEAMIVLGNHGWPGNVRELQNTVERVVVMNPDVEELGVELLPDGVLSPRAGIPGAALCALPYEAARARFEQEYLEGLLKRSVGNISEAARLAGMSRGHLHRKIAAAGIDIDDLRRRGT